MLPSVADCAWGYRIRKDSTTPVVFGPLQFEQTGADQQSVIVQVDADLTATSLTMEKGALETLLKSKLDAFAGSLQPNTAITFDQLAVVIRDDTKFALVRSRSVFAFDQEAGGFTELRDNDPAYTVPANGTVRVRAVRITEGTS